jgi:hypothetical protein
VEIGLLKVKLYSSVFRGVLEDCCGMDPGPYYQKGFHTRYDMSDMTTFDCNQEFLLSL